MRILDQGITGDKGNFAVYKYFQTEEEVKDFKAIMDENNIFVKVKAKHSVLGEAITGNSIEPEYWVELQQGDFPAANTALRAEAERALENVDIDRHYLNDLSDEELKELLYRPDEWSAEAVLIAERLLAHRGQNVNESHLMEVLQKRSLSLKKARGVSPIWTGLHLLNAALSGVLMVFFGTILFLISTIIAFTSGLYYYNTRSTTVDGESFFVFNAQTRRNGKLIIFIAFASLVLSLVYRFFVTG